MRPESRRSDLTYLLKARKGGIRRRDLELRWNCSAATVRRIIESARVEPGLPIQYHPKEGVYRLDAEKAIEVPGLWFGDDELIALVSLSHWIENLGAGTVARMLSPLKPRLEALLVKRDVQLGEWKERIKLLSMNARAVPGGILEAVSESILKRTKLAFRYQGVKDSTPQPRRVSPQTLVRYRDNWVLDAYCHGENGLRIFALSRMKDPAPLAESAQEIPRSELDAHFAQSYGLFGGKARYKAVVTFEGMAARLVATESWHPDQVVRPMPDGKVRFEFPCADLRELVRDLMRYADEVTVEKPEALRKTLSDMVSKAASRLP